MHAAGCDLSLSPTSDGCWFSGLCRSIRAVPTLPDEHSTPIDGPDELATQLASYVAGVAHNLTILHFVSVRRRPNRSPQPRPACEGAHAQSDHAHSGRHPARVVLLRAARPPELPPSRGTPVPLAPQHRLAPHTASTIWPSGRALPSATCCLTWCLCPVMTGLTSGAVAVTLDAGLCEMSSIGEANFDRPVGRGGLAPPHRAARVDPFLPAHHRRTRRCTGLSRTPPVLQRGDPADPAPPRHRHQVDPTPSPAPPSPPPPTSHPHPDHPPTLSLPHPHHLPPPPPPPTLPPPLSPLSPRSSSPPPHCLPDAPHRPHLHPTPPPPTPPPPPLQPSPSHPPDAVNATTVATLGVDQPLAFASTSAVSARAVSASAAPGHLWVVLYPSLRISLARARGPPAD